MSQNHKILFIFIDLELTDDLLVAQAFSFLSAGVETVTNTVSFTLHELARNQQLQDQVRGEIFASLERHGGLSYQGVAELKLLEMCLKETMRKYPATKHLLRVCTAEYDLDENLRLETGDCLVIPLSGIHNDPANFDNPEEYRPERFREAPAAGTYIPFGDGPRICLGINNFEQF
ncbi:hypothetical protein AAG570_006531 [Ranatra chinensis]|uniref:Cytochrome P450 n=1 Tax=Ranatra chinensis TaxID=642074 RepID=A0ABD0YU91_9HEMI